MTPRASLVVVGGPLAGERFPLAAELVLGRGPEIQVRLDDDDQVSRRHASVRAIAGGFEVEDLGSKNGTFVNDARIAGPAAFGLGDLLRVGGSTFRLEAAETRTAVEIPVAPAETGLSPRRDVTPPPAAPPPAPVAPPTPAPAAASLPDRRFAPPAARTRRRAPASRIMTGAYVTFAAVLGTAAALIAYFAARGSRY